MSEARRTHRRAGAAVVGLGLLLAACGDGSDDGTSRSSASGLEGDFCARVQADVDAFVGAVRAEWTPPTERYGGTAVATGAADLAGMNPLVAAEYTTSQHHAFVNLMTLVQFDEELSPVPYLAEAWELNADTTALTFHLRDDVFWHDGVRTTAEDVLFTFRRMNDPDVGYATPVIWDPYDKGPDGVEVPDSFTITFHFTRRPRLDDIFDGWRTTPPVPAHLLEDVPSEELTVHPYNDRCPVGNGPFVFREHLPGDRWTFEANPTFPEGIGGRPYLDRLVFRVVSEQTTALTELLTGGSDLWSQTAPEAAERIREAEDVELRVYPFRDMLVVAWNTRIEKLRSSRVRQALARGLDRERMIDAVLLGHGEVAQTTIPPFHWAYDPSFEDAIVHDPERARGILDEAGWRDRDGDGVRENAEGVRLSIELVTNADSDARRRVAELIQADLKEIGVEITIKTSEYNAVIERITDPAQRDFEAFVIGFAKDFTMDDRDLFHSERADGRFAFVGLDDPELDRLMDSIPQVTDREAAKRVWRAYQERFLELQPMTPIWFNERLAGVRTRLRGVVTDIRGEWITARKWWIAPEDRRNPR